ncbi:MAG: hypothetical protein K0S47_3100 [Herbinix sp.]|jgi:dipeptidase E|nr:hypothetical protein [Herbinix sp.]
MLVLSSNGLSSDILMNEVNKYVTKDFRNAAIITTASVGYKINDRIIPRLTDEIKSLNLAVTYFDIDDDPVEELYHYDVIEFIGGNPYYLLNSLRQKDCAEILHNIDKNKIIIGISAGSLVLENTIGIIDCFEAQMNDTIGLTDFTGMNLTNIQIIPHYSRFLKRYENLDERIASYEAKNSCQVIRLNDGQAVFIENQNNRTVG